MKNKNHHYETIIIGSGFSGLMTAVKLQKNHLTDYLILERNDELGGTWQVNSYPGAEVDIPTSLYSISSIGYPFRKTFATRSELLAYTNHIIDRFNLRTKARTNQTVTRLNYDEDNHLWRVLTKSGEKYTCRFIVDTSGVLANPHYPDIPGADSFKGSLFHAGHWDHSVDYSGKNVGVIGSGCSAAQIVPAIADKVSRLNLFMGKAQWILPKVDRTFGTAERMIRILPGIRQLIRLIVFIHYDSRFVAFREYPGTTKISNFIKSAYKKRMKDQLEKHIQDDQLRKHMMPDYEIGSRRVIPSNNYLPTLARDNVNVDISGIERITEKGIKTNDGSEISLDVIVYATGYYAYSNMKKALTFQVYGLGGRNLNSEWEDEAVSYKGIMVSGYPNYFKINGPNTGTGHSSQMSYMQASSHYIVQAICSVRRRRSIKAIHPKLELQEKYIANMKANMKKTIWQNGTCNAFYRKNMSGEVTSLSPEPVTGFIWSRMWFNLNDYQKIQCQSKKNSGTSKIKTPLLSSLTRFLRVGSA